MWNFRENLIRILSVNIEQLAPVSPSHKCAHCPDRRLLGWKSPFCWSIGQVGRGLDRCWAPLVIRTTPPDCDAEVQSLNKRSQQGSLTLNVPITKLESMHNNDLGASSTIDDVFAASRSRCAGLAFYYSDIRVYLYCECMKGRSGRSPRGQLEFEVCRLAL